MPEGLNWTELRYPYLLTPKVCEDTTFHVRRDLAHVIMLGSWGEEVILECACGPSILPRVLRRRGRRVRTWEGGKQWWEGHVDTSQGMQATVEIGNSKEEDSPLELPEAKSRASLTCFRLLTCRVLKWHVLFKKKNVYLAVLGLSCVHKIFIVACRIFFTWVMQTLSCGL